MKINRFAASVAGAALVLSMVSIASPAYANTKCTLTQGYYKTHADSLKNRYELTLLNITSGSSLFFSSGLTVQQVLDTPPSGGNAYLIAAKQFIAAAANGSPGETGFNPPGTSVVVSNAYQLLLSYFKGGSFTRDQVLAAASVLDMYNNGLLDIPHCA